MAQFKILIRRDRRMPGLANILREQSIIIPIDAEEGGFTIEIHHLARGQADGEPIKISGYMGDDVLSTTVEFKDSPRVKRTTPRIHKNS